MIIQENETWLECDIMENKLTLLLYNHSARVLCAYLMNNFFTGKVLHSGS